MADYCNPAVRFVIREIIGIMYEKLWSASLSVVRYRETLVEYSNRIWPARWRGSIVEYAVNIAIPNEGTSGYFMQNYTPAKVFPRSR